MAVIIIPQVVTGSGTATFVFELEDGKGERLTNVAPGTTTVSLRKQATPRTSHELTHLPALLDDVAGVVTLDLTVAQTTALVSPILTTPEPQQFEVIGDVRIVQGAEVNYFGPFMFLIRLPETFTGQAVPVLALNVVGGLSTDATPETAELTIAQVGSRISYPAFTDKYQLIWRLATQPDLTSVVFASDTTADNMIGGYTLWPNQVTLNDGRDGKVLVSNQLLTHIADTLELA